MRYFVNGAVLPMVVLSPTSPRERSIRMLSIRAVGAVTVLTLVAVFTGSPNDSVAGKADVCADPGRRLPVLLVPGFNSSSKIFTADYPGLYAALRDEGTVAVDLFNYPSDGGDRQWVVPEAAIALGDQAICLANKSARNGGFGKVVLIGHSMGGLTIRGALQGMEVADDTAAVITLGTPHNGAMPLLTVEVSSIVDPIERLNNQVVEAVMTRVCSLARSFVDVCGLATAQARAAMTPGSDELTYLNQVPRNIPFYGVAGSVRLRTSVLDQPLDLGPFNNDLVVSTDSALYGVPASNGHRKEVVCENVDPVTLLWRLATTNDVGLKLLMPDCWHGGLIEHPKTIEFVLQVLRGFPDCQRASCQSTLPTTQPPSITQPPSTTQPRITDLNPRDAAADVAQKFVGAWNIGDRTTAEDVWSDSTSGDYTYTFSEMWDTGGGEGLGPVPAYPYVALDAPCDYDPLPPGEYVNFDRGPRSLQTTFMVCDFAGGIDQFGEFELYLVNLDGRWFVWQAAFAYRA
jgi:triacylglycerol esterase/lipase EstA (alpha/beta hydrolase family)